jgi:hypothetical protein
METIDKLCCERDKLKERLSKLKDVLDKCLDCGDTTENISGVSSMINSCQRELEVILKNIRSCGPVNHTDESEQDRKAIAIIAGGKGVEIRAKNDDQTKYTAKKKLTYDEIIKKRTATHSNGQSKQQQQPVKI